MNFADTPRNVVVCRALQARWSAAAVARVAEDPGFCGENAAADLKREMSHTKLTAPEIPPCDIPSGCCSFTGPWTVTRSSLRMLRRVAAFCRPLRSVLLLVSFPRSRSPVVGVLGLCWMWGDVPFARQRKRHTPAL